MNRVGTASRTAQGVVVVRLDGDDPPEIGTVVVDDSLSRVGRVVDVFGPVDAPYVAVAPAGDAAPASLVGTKLYAR
jgi:RNA-binding protein